MKTVVFFSLEQGRLGGITAVNQSLKEALEKEGVTVLEWYLRAHPETEKSPCGTVIRPSLPWRFTEGREIRTAVKEKHFLSAAKKVLCRLRDLLQYRADLRRARSLLMKTAPDAVITSHYLLLDAVPTPLLSRTVHHVHTSFSETMNQQANAKTLLRFNGKISFLWLSKNILRSAEEAGFLFSHYLYNPLSRFPAERTRAELQRDVVLLTRFSEEKRLPLAVELCRRAMEKIPFHQQGRVLFYGAGPEEEALRQAIGEDPRFVIMGRTDDPYAALQSARFTLNTSLFEGFSIAVLEAAAAGVPTLSFCFGEAASEEITDGITGRLVPMDENEAFVSALCALWTEDETVRSLSEEARRFALGFTKEKSGEALLAILSRLPLDKTEKES